MSAFIQPTEDQVDVIFEHAKAGFDAAEIARLMGGDRRTGDRHMPRWVERVLHDFDPYIDEVALDRAADGDREVYRALTPTERREFVRRAEAGFRSERLRWGQPSTGRRSDLESKRWLLDALGVSESHWRAMVRDG